MDLISIIAGISALLLSVSVHEAAHGWAADRFGDPTARELGRITINPIKHIDPFMSVILPLILIVSGSGIIFGGAKPVPFNPNRMRRGLNIKKAIMWVAAAGPISNFLMAFISLFIATSLQARFGYTASSGIVGAFLEQMYLINLVLGMFNLLPIPPLDGAKVLAGLLPDRQALALYRLERYAMLFFVLIILTPISDLIFFPMGLLDGVFRELVSWLVW